MNWSTALPRSVTVGKLVLSQYSLVFSTGILLTDTHGHSVYPLLQLLYLRRTNYAMHAQYSCYNLHSVIYHHVTHLFYYAWYTSWCVTSFVSRRPFDQCVILVKAALASGRTSLNRTCIIDKKAFLTTSWLVRISL